VFSTRIWRCMRTNLRAGLSRMDALFQRESETAIALLGARAREPFAAAGTGLSNVSALSIGL